jgi:hypothetical protein
MKYIMILTAAVFLAACNEEKTQSTTSSLSFAIECIDGVEYWRARRGKGGYMAVRVDPNTMTFVRCAND